MDILEMSLPQISFFLCPLFPHTVGTICVKILTTLMRKGFPVAIIFSFQTLAELSGLLLKTIKKKSLTLLGF